MTDPNHEPEQESPPSTADFITDLALGIQALSERLGVLEFLKDIEEEDGRSLNEEDAALLKAGEEALEIALNVIGHGNDGQRMAALHGIDELIGSGEDHLCEDCRKGMY